MVFSENGKLLAAAAGSTAKIWYTATGALMKELAHEGDFMWVHFCSNDTRLISGSTDGKIKMWDTISWDATQEVDNLSTLTALTFHQDRYFACGLTDGSIRLWKRCTTAWVSQWTLKSSRWIDSLAISSDGLLLASSEYGTTVSIWDVETGNMLHTIRGQETLAAVKFSQKGQTLVIASDEGLIEFWNTQNWNLERTLQTEGYFTDFAISPNDKYIATNEDLSSITVWDIEKGAVCQVAEGHIGPIRGVIFSSDGQFMASVGGDSTTRLWNFAPGISTKRSGARLSERSWIEKFQFSKDKKIVAVIPSRDLGYVNVWSTETGVVVKTLANAEYEEGTLDEWLESFEIEHSSGTKDESSDKAISLTNTAPSQELQVSVDQGWLVIGSQKSIWLPPDCRPTHFHISESYLLTLGMPDLHVYIISFNPAEMSPEQLECSHEEG